MAITYEHVATIAHQMVTNGEDPTVRKVRNALGEGSLGTIHKHLSTWRTEKTPPTQRGTTLSEELQRTMVREIERVVTSATAGTGTELARTKVENDDLARECEKREKEIEELRLLLVQEREELQRARGENRMLLSELDRERKEGEDARSERTKAELRLEDLPRLREEINTLRENVQRENEGRVDAEKRSAVAEALLLQLHQKK